jgi:hypothetical protein
MNYAASLDSIPASDLGAFRRTSVAVGVGTFLVASFWTVLGADSTREILLVLPLAAVIAGLVDGLLLPRSLERGRAGGVALSLGIVAVLLTLPAFWSGLPLILGAAAVLLGSAGRGTVAASGQGSGGKATAALVLGALAVVGYLVIYLVDGVVMGHL